jgi:hypothetical protein
MTTDTHIAEKSNRRTASSALRTGVSRPWAWIRDHPGAMTLPSQQAVDAIYNSPDFPRY